MSVKGVSLVIYPFHGGAFVYFCNKGIVATFCETGSFCPRARSGGKDDSAGLEFGLSPLGPSCSSKLQVPKTVTTDR